MLSKPEEPFIDRFKKIDFLEEVNNNKKIEKKRRIISNGRFKEFSGELIDSAYILNVRGFSIYGYDFGIFVPKGRRYPLFMFQIISLPKRMMAIINYPYIDPEEEIKGFKSILDMDEELSEDILLKSSKPQFFISNDIIENKYNGLVRTTDIDKIQSNIIEIFNKWHSNLETNYNDFDEQGSEYVDWLKDFKDTFYDEDYGYTTAKRYLGKKWADNIFNNYLRK